MKKVLKYLLTLVMIMTINVCPVFASEPEKIYFDLQSTVYDDGEAIDTVIMDVSGANIDESKINKDTLKLQLNLHQFIQLNRKMNFLV